MATTLEDVAKKVTSLAQLNLTRGKTRAYKTGNLYNKVGSYNTVDRVLGKKKLGKKRKKLESSREDIELNLVYNPPGAEYGQFVEEGTRYMKPRPFAEEALNSPIIDKMIDEALGNYVEDNILPGLQAELDTIDDIE
jgi:hypothetical protein